jgi:hypothetical protein
MPQTTQLKIDLEAAKMRFINEINELREKYFSDKEGLKIIASNTTNEIGFSIDFDSLKIQD